MPEMPEFSIQHTAGEPEVSAGAKGWTKPPKAISKPPQSHILGIYSAYTPEYKATTEPPQSHLVGNQLRPQSHPKATLKPHQSHTKATPKRPQSLPKASYSRHFNTREARFPRLTHLTVPNGASP